MSVALDVNLFFFDFFTSCLAPIQFLWLLFCFIWASRNRSLWRCFKCRDPQYTLQKWFRTSSRWAIYSLMRWLSRWLLIRSQWYPTIGRMRLIRESTRVYIWSFSFYSSLAHLLLRPAYIALERDFLFFLRRSVDTQGWLSGRIATSHHCRSWCVEVIVATFIDPTDMIVCLTAWTSFTTILSFYAWTYLVRCRISDAWIVLLRARADVMMVSHRLVRCLTLMRYLQAVSWAIPRTFKSARPSHIAGKSD